MEPDKIKETFDSWENILLPIQKRYMHFRSMRNFALYYDQLPETEVKQKVAALLGNYIDEVQENLFDYKGKRSYGLVKKYMNKISPYYETSLGFRSFFIFQFAIVFSIVGDGVLFLLLKSRISFYFPIVSLILLTYYFYTKIYFEKKKKVFGIFY